MPTVFYKTHVRSRYLAQKRYLLHVSAKYTQKPTTMYVDTVCFFIGHFMRMRSVRSYQTFYADQREYVVELY